MIKWLVMSEGHAPPVIFDNVEDATMGVLGWDDSDFDLVDSVECRLHNMFAGMITVVVGQRVLKFIDQVDDVPSEATCNLMESVKDTPIETDSEVVTFDMTLFDDEAIKERLTVMSALETMFNDSRNAIPDAYYEIVDLTPGQTLRATFEILK